MRLCVEGRGRTRRVLVEGQELRKERGGCGGEWGDGSRRAGLRTERKRQRRHASYGRGRQRLGLAIVNRMTSGASQREWHRAAWPIRVEAVLPMAPDLEAGGVASRDQLRTLVPVEVGRCEADHRGRAANE